VKKKAKYLRKWLGPKTSLNATAEISPTEIWVIINGQDASVYLEQTDKPKFKCKEVYALRDFLNNVIETYEEMKG